MALTDILKRIEEDTQKELAALDKEWQQYKHEKDKSFSIFEDEYMKKASQRADRAGERHRERLLTRAKSEASMKILQKKRELLERVFDEVEKTILKSSASDKNWLEIFEKIPEKQGTLVLPKAYEATLGKKVSAKYPSIKIKPTTEFSEGFVLESGRISYDNRLSSLLLQARDIYQDEMVDFLFGEG